jgi:hypothetical protein
MNDAVGLNQLYHPMMEGFTAVSFRAPMATDGAQSFEHSSGVDPDDPDAGGFTSEDAECAEANYPSVLAGHAFGALAGGDFDYVTMPQASRARGGTANGGFMFHPPEFELEDYFGVNSDNNVSAPSTTGYVVAAPGVGFAVGTPNTDGTIADGGGIFRINTNPVFEIASSTGDVQVFYGQDDGGVGYLYVSGTGAMRVPTGTNAQRPSISVNGEIRVNTDATALEFYQGGWQQLTPGGVTTYEALTDTPSGYGSSGDVVTSTGAAHQYETPVTTFTGVANQLVRTNGSGLLDAFVTPPSPPTWLALTDTPGSFTSLKICSVNSGATAIHFGGPEVTTAGEIDMNTQLIKNVANTPGTGGDALNVTIAVATFMPLLGGTFQGTVTHNDNQKIEIGTLGADGEIYSDGTDFYIGSTGTADLRINSDMYLRADSRKIWFGLGEDASIYYDGTDFVLHPHEVGTGAVRIGTGDSDKLVFGQGKDASIYYDGTDLRINAKDVGVGKTTFDGVVNAVGGFQDNGTAGVDVSQFTFYDSDLFLHTVTVSGGLITEWTVGEGA